MAMKTVDTTVGCVKHSVIFVVGKAPAGLVPDMDRDHATVLLQSDRRIIARYLQPPSRQKVFLLITSEKMDRLSAGISN
jgi:hypothetical protein